MHWESDGQGEFTIENIERGAREINIDHPLVRKLSAETDEQRFDALSNVILDDALLAEGTQLSNPAAYVRRMNRLLLDLDGG